MIDTVTLGRTALEVPRICLGTMTWGEQNTMAEAHAQLDWAFERGLSFIDTAEMYPIPVRAETGNTTERYIGEWLARKPRDRVILASKVAGPGRGMDWIRTGAREGLPHLGKRDIVLACEASLSRLRTDYLDLYQIHWPARNVPMFGAGGFDPSKDRDCASIDEQLEAMDQLVRDGKVRHVGVSNETPWGVSRFVNLAERYGLPRIATIQNVYNLMSREYEVALHETCHREQVSLLAYSPLAFGYLSGKYFGGARPAGARITLFGEKWARYSKPRIGAAADEYAALARRHGLTPVQLALSFAFHRPFVASTIVGATSLAQLEECVDAWNTRLAPEIVSQIDAIHERFTNPAL